MRRLRTPADVQDASADPMVRWAAQALSAGGAAWEHRGAVAVHAPYLTRRRRLVMSGPAEGVDGAIVAHVNLGASHRLRARYDVDNPQCALTPGLR